MRCLILLVAALAQTVLSAEWIVDESCNAYKVGVEEAMEEALELAENAAKVMTEDANDRRVQDMTRCMLGDDIGFQAKYEQVKQIYRNLGAFSPQQWLGVVDSSNLGLTWMMQQSNRDVVIYCDSGRIKREPHPRKAGRRIGKDSSMGDRLLSEQSIQVHDRCDNPQQPKGGRLRAFTTGSDLIDEDERKRAVNPHPNDFLTETVYADSIQICKATLEVFQPKRKEDSWPKVDLARIKYATSKKKMKELQAKGKAAIDSVQTLGYIMLHELTHTHTGGKLIDVKVGSAKEDPAAYGWRKCGSVTNPENSDTIAMLAVALKVYSLGKIKGKYYVDRNGMIASG